MKKRGPKNIEEYVARFCAIALKTRKIEEQQTLIDEQQELIDHYEHLLEDADWVGTCHGCMEMSALDELHKCEKKPFHKYCEFCKTTCYNCDAKSCKECTHPCDIDNCVARVCDDCSIPNSLCNNHKNKE
jgi:hypothetical protein